VRTLRLVRDGDSRAPLDDAGLLALVKRGDPAGSEALFGRYAAPILGFTTRMLGNRSEGEEIAQEVFVRLIDRAQQYDGRAPVSSWLFAIAANACRDRLRVTRRSGSVSLEAVPEPHAPDPSAETAAIGAERARRVRQALALLSQEQREALILARYHELPYVEIARTLGITEGAVKTRIYRAMETLKSHFSEGETSWNAAKSPACPS
jgi:RNA polymerase sigma-70 factor (ECF subfamily)